MTPNGTAIGAFRQARDLSIRRTAEQAGLSPAFLSRIEKGQRGASVQSLRLIADVLKVPLAAINREEQS